MKTLYITLAALLICSSQLMGRQITLEQCQEQAKANYPLINQYDLLEKSKSFSLDNLTKNWLPQVNFTAQATYQSDITNMPFNFASLGLPISIPSISKDQYKAYFDVNQLIWDGGKLKSQQQITEAETKSNRTSLENQLYALRERVDNLYFGILSIDETLKVLDIKEKDIQTALDLTNSMLRNGTAMQSDADRITVELYNLDQQRTQQKSSRKAFCRMLSIFINNEIGENDEFQKPAADFTADNSISRPEIADFDSQIALLDARTNAITTSNKPRLGLFLQTGIGRPALNMFNNNFKLYAMGGVRFTWNFTGFYTKDNDSRLLETQRESIQIRRKTFLFNTNQQLAQASNEIEKYQNLLKSDDAIIELNQRVHKATESKFRNGTGTSLDLMKDLDAVESARQTRVLHEVQYLQSIYNYKYIQGK